MQLEDLKQEKEMLEKTISSYQTKMNRLLEIESVREYCYYSSMEEQIETGTQESKELRRQIRQKHIDRLLEIDEVKEYCYYYEFCQGYEAQLDIIKRQIQLIEAPNKTQRLKIADILTIEECTYEDDFSYVCGNLGFGETSDNQSIELPGEEDSNPKQEQSGPVLTKKPTTPRNTGNE